MLGTGPFAVPTLEALASSPHEVAARRHPPTARPRRTGAPAAAGGRGRSASPSGNPKPSTSPNRKPASPLSTPTCSSSATTAKSSAPQRSPRRASAASTSTARSCPSIAAPRRAVGHPQRRHRNRQHRHPNDARASTPARAWASIARRSIPTKTPASSKRGCSRRGAELVLRVVDALAAGTAKPIEQNRRRGDQGAAAQEGAGRHRLVAPRDRDQEPGASPRPLAAGVHSLAPRRWRAVAADRPSRATSWQARDPRNASRAQVVETQDRLVVATGDGALEILASSPPASGP